MKKLGFILFVILCMSRSVVAQNSPPNQVTTKENYICFILNEDVSSLFRIDKVELSSTDNFNCEDKLYQAEIYNLHPNKHTLIVFSLLPSLTDQKVHWEKITEAKIKSNQITFSSLLTLCNRNNEDFIKYGFKNAKEALVKLTNIKIVIKKADGYYVNSSVCLTEFFATVSLLSNGFANENPINVIDTNLTPLSIGEFETQYLRKHGAYSYNSNFEDVNLVRPRFPALLYSHSGIIQNLRIHYFWTLATWPEHGSAIRRGIDRFIFNGEIGIIGGDYSFYFGHYFKSQACKELGLQKYLNNELRLLPIKIIRNFKGN